MSETATLQTWALLEIMGHRRRAGFLQEVEVAGVKMLRIDIPAGEVTVSEYYGGASVYAIRPMSEELARDYAISIGDPRPVRPAAYRPAEIEDRSGFEDEIAF